MRINGFEQIKGFYSWTFENQGIGVKPQHISLYLFLVNQNNRNNWVEWFKVPFDLGMAGSCISSKKTYYKCLADLQEWNLIYYQPGVNNWKAPLIKLEVLKDTSTVPQSEPQLAPQVLPQHIQQLVLQATPQPIHNIKLLTSNLQLVTYNIEKIILDYTPVIKTEGIDIPKAARIILKEFGYNEITNFDKLSLISTALTHIVNSGRHEYFEKQYKDYLKFKYKSRQTKQGLDTFFGTKTNYENPGWDNQTWADALKGLNIIDYTKPSDN